MCNSATFVACPWIRAACPCRAAAAAVVVLPTYYVLTGQLNCSIYRNFAGADVLLLSHLVCNSDRSPCLPLPSARHPLTLRPVPVFSTATYYYYYYYVPLVNIMLALSMPSITSNLGPLALWALFGLASMSSFAAASGDSSSEDGGAAASSSEDTDDALGNNNSTEYFSVPAFFITFRETIEVCVLAINRSQLLVRTRPLLWLVLLFSLFLPVMYVCCRKDVLRLCYNLVQQTVVFVVEAKA